MLPGMANNPSETAVTGEGFGPADNYYYYDALDPTRLEFRVLLLSPYDSAGRLYGSLKVVSMLDEPKPEYKTISYAWGDNTLSNYILLDGRCLNIPASAHQALNGILHKGYEGPTWIDSVCINQSDEREREQQITMMGGEMGIYSNGRLNLIWLGGSDASTLQAVQGIELILDDMRQASGGDFQVLSKMLQDPRTGDDLFSTTPWAITFNHQAVLEFFRRSWFQRLWVVQEAALAPSSVMICGNFEIQLLDALWSVRWCCYKFDFMDFTDASVYSFGDLEAPKALFDVIKRDIRSDYGLDTRPNVWPPHVSVLHCLLYARWFETTLPVDRVFAMLGLIEAHARHSDLLRPDYSKSLIHVLRDATYAAAIEYNHTTKETWNSAILSAVSHHTNENVQGEIFPSWVAQWHR